MESYAGRVTYLQETERPKISDEEALLENAAVNAQNDGKFRDAAQLWRDLIEKFPHSALNNKALHQLGICEVKLENYEAAELALREAIKRTNPAEVQALGRAQLFLGFSRLRLGERALREQRATEANQWLTSAAEALAAVHEKYPQFPDQDEAAYFQGSAYELLETTDQAIAAYRRVLDKPTSKFKLDALWALGDLEARRRNFAAAKGYLEQYLSEGDETAQAHEVRMRAARVNWELAREAKSAGQDARATELLNQAKQQFEQVAAADAKLREEALLQLAILQAQTGETAKAQANFAVVARGSNAALATAAAINLGQQALAAQDGSGALTWFDRALELDGNFAEAAHGKVQALLALGQFPAAYDFAGEAAAKLTPPSQYRLQFDRAEAAYRMPEKVAEALDLYTELSERDWPDAPRSLYNAAFAALTLKQSERAIALADAFRTRHPQHPFLPDAIEVETEARIARGDFATAARLLADLIAQFPNHKKQNPWRLRAGAAHVLANSPSEAQQWLGPIASAEPPVEGTAEALYWLGLAASRSGAVDTAIANFERAAKLQPAARMPELLAALAEAQGQADQWSAAEATAERLAEAFPESDLASRALYRIAQHHREAGEKAKADALFARLAKMDRAGLLAPFAALNRGLLKLESREWDEARTEFERALAAADQDRTLRHQAHVGLATAYRNLNRPSEAIELLQKVLADDPAPLTAVDASYELGLNHVAEKNWNEAIKVFTVLLDKTEAAEIAHQVRYELAWAYRGNQQSDLAIAEFMKLAETVPNSTIGADALFQVAEDHYAAKRFAEAIAAYDKALGAAPESLAERIRYRLGWAYFNLGDYPNSYAQFERQTKDFPNGRLLADGLYMLSESAFQQQQYETAYRHFREARPVMKASPSVSKTNLWLSDLHAAQSANQLKKFEEARDFATSLTEDPAADEGLRADAYLQLGLAHQGLNDPAAATAAWTKAASDLSKTGAQARYLLGATLFAQKNFKDAILQFSLVRNGYGGKSADPDIDPWQALATFEIARCKNCLAQVAAQENNPELSRELVREAIQYLRDLIAEFPQDRLAPDAEREIQKLQQYLNKNSSSGGTYP